MMNPFKIDFVEMDYRDELDVNVTTQSSDMFYLGDTEEGGTVVKNAMACWGPYAKEVQRNALGLPYHIKEKVTFTGRNDPSLRPGHIILLPYYSKYVKVLLESCDRSLVGNPQCTWVGYIIEYTDISIVDFQPIGIGGAVVQNSADKAMDIYVPWTEGSSVLD